MIGSPGSTSVLRWMLVPFTCFGIGWGAAEVDAKTWLSVRTLLAETYLNKFNAMSGADVDEYIYYVISDDPETLRQVVRQETGVNRIEGTDLPSVFNAHIGSESRRRALSHLRSLPSVSAVFTVPFMCH